MNLKTIISFYLVLASISTVFSQSKVILKEQFENNDENWEIVDNRAEFTEIKLGKYLMETKDKNNWHWFYLESNLDSKRNFLIESNIAKLKEGKKSEILGLIWGAENNTNFFTFKISTKNGFFSVQSVYNGKSFYLINWTKSNEINYDNSSNKLGVAKINNELVFIINDEIVGKTSFQQFYGQKIGFYVSPEMTIAADNLYVNEIDYFDDSEKLKKSEWQGNGTGFFIDENGYIATNYHVVKEANEIEIEFIRNGIKQTFPAKVIQSDKQNDISIIKINSQEFKSYDNLPYNFKTNISDVGSNIFTLGYPMALSLMGTEIKFTDGKISSKTGIQGDITTYQVSVPIQPGNSGGPLFDYDGNLIGITSSGVNRELDITENVNYAIKSSYLKNLVDVLDYKLTLPNDRLIANKTLTEKIKILSDYVVLIKIK